MSDALGDEYTAALRASYPDVPESSDFVMYWWHKAAAQTREGNTARFGLITINSLRQTYNRRVLEHHLGGNPVSIPSKPAFCVDSQSSGSHLLPQEINLPSHSGHLPRQKDALPAQEKRPAASAAPVFRLELPPLSLRFAIPDHPWVDAAEGAAVRIAMTSGSAGSGSGRLVEVISEAESGEDATQITLAETTGTIHADLSVGVDINQLIPLESNGGLACPGVQFSGQGFVVAPEEAGYFINAVTKERLLRRYITGRASGSLPSGSTRIANASRPSTRS